MPVKSFKFDLIVALICFVLISSTDLYILSQIGVALFAFFVSKTVNGLGKEIDIRGAICCISYLQWIIGPILAYTFFPDEQMFNMAVSEIEYMDYVVPATFALSLGLYLPLWKKPIHETQILVLIKRVIKRYPNLDLLLVLMGTILFFARPYLPRNMNFFLYLMGNLRFIGLFFMLLNQRPYKWLIFGAVSFWVVSVILFVATFHRLLLWLGFMFLIISFIYKISTTKKIIITTVLLFFTFLIQVVKNEFRNMGMMNRDISSFSNLVASKLDSPEDMFHDVYLSSFVTRINQGWIISHILYHTPRFEPFADGETIEQGLKDSFLPRFLNTEKGKAGGHVNFTRFTGVEIGLGTSMDLSILGEAYANYGKGGGMVLMFILGLFYNFILFKFFQLSRKYPSLLFFIPMVFLQLIKAETDFSSTINYFTKATFTTALIFFGIRKFLNMKI